MNSVQSKFMASEELQRMPRAEAARILGCSADWLQKLARVNNLLPAMQKLSARRQALLEAKTKFLASPDLQNQINTRVAEALGVNTKQVRQWRSDHNIKPAPRPASAADRIRKHPDFRIENGILVVSPRKIAKETHSDIRSVWKLMSNLGWKSPVGKIPMFQPHVLSPYLEKWGRPDNMNDTVIPLIRSKRERLRHEAN